MVNVETHIDPPAYLYADQKYDLSVCTADFVRIPPDWCDRIYAKVLEVQRIDRENEAMGLRIKLDDDDERAHLLAGIRRDKRRGIPEPIAYHEKATASKSVRILDETSWPDETVFGMDKSQYAAFKSALTKEISILQGPPGNLLCYIRRKGDFRFGI